VAERVGEERKEGRRERKERDREREEGEGSWNRAAARRLVKAGPVYENGVTRPPFKRRQPFPLSSVLSCSLFPSSPSPLFLPHPVSLSSRPFPSP